MLHVLAGGQIGETGDAQTGAPGGRPPQDIPGPLRRGRALSHDRPLAAGRAEVGRTHS